MSYEKFAYHYDQLMTDAPYEQWVSFVLKVINKYGINKGKSILDIGCGTGNISIPLSKAGYELTAVDISEEMLFISSEKSEKAKVNIHFFQQDMKELEGLGKFSTVICLCDSLNYLASEDEVKETIKRVYHHLEEDGIFIFDVHSIYKVDFIFKGNTFAHNGEEVSYIWECFEGEENHSVEHDLSFFVKDTQGLYERFDEIHKQRTYPISIFEKALKEVGFTILSITGDFSFDNLNKDDHRWFFVAKK